jgi:hypothetical protein
MVGVGIYFMFKALTVECPNGFGIWVLRDEVRSLTRIQSDEPGCWAPNRSYISGHPFLHFFL